jgi:hypothetical protein
LSDAAGNYVAHQEAAIGAHIARDCFTFTLMKQQGKAGSHDEVANCEHGRTTIATGRCGKSPNALYLPEGVEAKLGAVKGHEE